MSSKKLFRALLFGLVLSFAFGPILVAGQQGETGTNPQDKPRTVKPEVKKAYRDWINKDVAYIITDAERRAFNRLTTDEERENFIEIFWRNRDPDPDTDENAANPETTRCSPRSPA